MESELIKIGQKVKLIKSGRYNGEGYTVVSVDYDDFKGDGNLIKRYLLEGEGLSGATTVDENGKIKSLKEQRYAYDYMVERVK